MNLISSTGEIQNQMKTDWWQAFTKDRSLASEARSERNTDWPSESRRGCVRDPSHETHTRRLPREWFGCSYLADYRDPSTATFLLQYSLYHRMNNFGVPLEVSAISSLAALVSVLLVWMMQIINLKFASPIQTLNAGSRRPKNLELSYVIHSAEMYEYMELAHPD